MLVRHYHWPLCWVSRDTFRTQVHEAKGTRWSSFVHGLKSELGAVLAHTLDLSKVKATGVEGRGGNGPRGTTKCYRDPLEDNEGITWNIPNTGIGPGKLGLHVVRVFTIVANDNASHL